MRGMRSSRVALAAGLILLAWGCAKPGTTATTRAWYADRLEKLGFFVFPAPVAVGDFAVETLKGGSYTLSGTRGKIVLLNFWATWCPPCRAEMPSIQSLWNKTSHSGFDIIAVSLDDDMATMSAFAERQKFQYPLYFDRSKRLGAVFNADSIPTTYLVDKGGRVIAGAKGSREYDSPEMIALVSELASR